MEFVPLPEITGYETDFEVISFVCTSSTPWPFNILMGQTRGVVRAIKEVLGTAGFKVSSIQRGGTKKHPEITKKDIRLCQKAVRRLIGR